MSRTQETWCMNYEHIQAMKLSHLQCPSELEENKIKGVKLKTAA